MDPAAWVAAIVNMPSTISGVSDELITGTADWMPGCLTCCEVLSCRSVIASIVETVTQCRVRLFIRNGHIECDVAVMIVVSISELAKVGRVSAVLYA